MDGRRNIFIQKVKTLEVVIIRDGRTIVAVVIREW